MSHGIRNGERRTGDGKLAIGRRDHVAIMKKSWGFIDKILSGEKTIESRWYTSRRKPWDAIRVGDVVYFKNVGELVTAKAHVKRVVQKMDLTPMKIKKILKRYGQRDGMSFRETPQFYERFKDKKYCILVFLADPERVSPFAIRKDGFGAMAAWMTMPRIASIKGS